MTSERTSLKDYEKIWTGHVEDLYRLKWTLIHNKDRDNLDEIITELKRLVKTATNDLKVRREQKW